MSHFPEVFGIRQHLPSHKIDITPELIASQVAALAANADLPLSGKTVAITGGSRGVRNIDTILRLAAESLRQRGAKPLIVPAMGSHGGGTAEGQQGVLQSYGITEEAIGCPVRASMEVVEIGQTALGFPVYFDRLAFQADCVLVVNRVKPHTRFDGPVQSGLLKMLMIGLGKHRGAETCHRAIEQYGFDKVLGATAEVVFQHCRVLGGIAIVEDAHDDTGLVEAVPPSDFFRRERELLELAQRWMPRLPVDHADVLLVDRIGKDISGTGMDTNVVGRKFNDHRAVEGETPRIGHICVRGLSPDTHGNAAGIGMSEFCLSRVLEDMDHQATRINAITANHVSAAMLPLDYPNDREMLTQALAGVSGPPSSAYLLWITDTLHLAELACSAAYLPELQCREDIEILDSPRPLPFDALGHLPDLTTLAGTQVPGEPG